MAPDFHPTRLCWVYTNREEPEASSAEAVCDQAVEMGFWAQNIRVLGTKYPACPSMGRSSHRCLLLPQATSTHLALHCLGRDEHTQGHTREQQTPFSSFPLLHCNTFKFLTHSST